MAGGAVGMESSKAGGAAAEGSAEGGGGAVGMECSRVGGAAVD